MRRRLFFLATIVMSIAILWPIKTAFAVGAAFAFVSETPLRWLKMRFKIKTKRMEWVFAFAFVIFAYSVFLVPLVTLIYTAAANVAALVSEHRTQLTPSQLSIRGADLLTTLLDKLEMEIPIQDIVRRLNSAAAEISQRALSLIGNFLEATPQVIFHTFVMLLVWVFFCVEGQKWRAILLPQIVPWKRERELIAKTTADVLRGSISANILVSLVQAFLMAVIFAAVSLPNVVLWAIFGFFSAFVPMVGTMLTLVAAAIYSFATGSTTKAIVILLSSAVVGTVDNVLRPMLMKGRSELNFFWLFCAFIGGVELFGPTGLVLGPLFFSLFVAFLRLNNEVKQASPKSPALTPPPSFESQPK